MDVSTVLTLVQTLLQVLNSPISRELESVWGYKSHLEKLRETISTIKAVFLDAEKLQKRQLLTHILKNKLQRLEEAVYRADDLFDEVATVARRKKLMTGNIVCREVQLFFTRFNQLSTAFKMSRDIRDIREMLDDIKNDHHIHDIGLFQPFDMEVRNNSRETHSFVCAEDVIIGSHYLLVNDVATVEEAVSVVSIVGILSTMMTASKVNFSSRCGLLSPGTLMSNSSSVRSLLRQPFQFSITFSVVLPKQDSRVHKHNYMHLLTLSSFSLT